MNDIPLITYGKKYLGMIDDKESHSEYIIKNDEGNIKQYNKTYFKKIEDHREDQINKLFQPIK